MRINKQRLKRIIREEKTKFLRESTMDTNLMQDVLGNFPETVAGAFGERMMQFFWEEDSEQTDTFRDTSEAEWEEQVHKAEQQLVDAIVMAVEDEVKNTENMLHDGDFAT